MTIWPWFILVTLYGACVGSFLNVVIYRLPEGRSLISPGSHCPDCGKTIAWYDNIPVLSWLFLRGKCRFCRTPISFQYPLVELITAALFAGLFAIYYFSDLRPGFSEQGLAATWPVLVVHLALLAALLAATVIDARLFIIPLPIPWVMTLIAVLTLPLSVAFGWVPNPQRIAPLATGPGVGAAIGGAAGLALSLILLQRRLLPRSFDEAEDQIVEPTQSDEFLDHPHPRREVLKESLFVALPLAGALIGLAAAFTAPDTAALPVRVLAGVVIGYLVGGGIVWITRILGTLAFGKEAMGLGDVHLLAAVGAVLGPLDAILVFFIAPFLGLTAALVMAGLTALLKGKIRIIPYGPYLAGATMLVMIFRRPMLAFFGIL